MSMSSSTFNNHNIYNHRSRCSNININSIRSTNDRWRTRHYTGSAPYTSTSALNLSPADLPHDPAVLTDAAHHLSSYLTSTLHLAASTAADHVTGIEHSLEGIEHHLERGLEGVEQSIEQVMATDVHLYSDLTPELEEMSLDVLGHDLLLFLAASVLVEPLSRVINVTPVLLYLLLGFIAGPNGMSLFLGGTEVDAQIGDFGILFLLFVEGLNLSPERLKALGSFFSLGATQLLCE